MKPNPAWQHSVPETSGSWAKAMLNTRRGARVLCRGFGPISFCQLIFITFLSFEIGVPYVALALESSLALNSQTHLPLFMSAGIEGVLQLP